jgi:hypothetical protein
MQQFLKRGFVSSKLELCDRIILPSSMFYQGTRNDSKDVKHMGRKVYLGKELGKHASLSSLTAPVQSMLRHEPSMRSKELDGILLPVVLSLSHLHYRLPCRTSNTAFSF